MELSNELCNQVSRALAEEFSEAAVNEELAGGNESYAIRPSYSFTVSGDPYIVYGVFNRLTGVREADAAQYRVAKEWVKALTRADRGDVMPGLGPDSGPAQAHTVQ